MGLQTPAPRLRPSRREFIGHVPAGAAVHLVGVCPSNAACGTRALVDRGEIARAASSCSIDASMAAALEISMRGAVGRRFGTKSRGGGEVVAAGESLAFQASLVERSSDTLTVSGPVKFRASGQLGASSFAVSTWTLQGFGARLLGSGGTISFVPNPADVSLVLSSGHPAGVASDAEPYLAFPGDAGPAIAASLVRSGLDVVSYAFVDHYYGTAQGPGQDDMVATLRAIRDRDVVGRAVPTRVVVVAHSHGGVRAHQAIADVPDLPVTLLVDLDTSSCDFNLAHLLEHTPDPVGAWSIGGVAYDDEDVVWENVAFNLEVRSGELCYFSILGELFDDSYNVRDDGTHTGLYFYESNTSHGEVHDGDGATVAIVIDWILDRLFEQ